MYGVSAEWMRCWAAVVVQAAASLRRVAVWPATSLWDKGFSEVPISAACGYAGHKYNGGREHRIEIEAAGTRNKELYHAGDVRGVK